MARTAKDIIDDAINENRFGTQLLYFFSVVFVLSGLGVIGWSLYRGTVGFGSIGAVLSGLSWPAMSATRRTRKENIAIRLLEAPLDNAATAEEAAQMLHELFQQIFGDTRKDG